MTKTYSKRTCLYCGRRISVAGAAWAVHERACRLKALRQRYKKERK